METVHNLKDEVLALARTTPHSIQHHEELMESCDWLLLIRKKYLAVEAFKTRVIGPMEAALKTAKTEFKTMTDALENAEVALKSAISGYAEKEHDDATTKQIQEIKDFENRLKESVGTGTEVRPPKIIELPPSLVETPSGQIIISTIKDWLIVNRHLIPDQYWKKTLDEVLIGKHIRQGFEIAGIKVIEKKSVSVKPNKGEPL